MEFLLFIQMYNINDILFFLNKLCLILSIANTLWNSTQRLLIFIGPILNLKELYKI